ncbi:MAG: endosialidase [Eubacteriales bacterium]|nr:endosialidase [Eubacteriales bacterium]
MAVVQELIRKEDNGTISFGNYELTQKTKLSDFEVNGDIYKVKTFAEITKLERNDMFVYESVPGTAVFELNADGNGMEFSVEGVQDAQITLELEAESEYTVELDGENTGKMTTNLGGKLTIGVELESGKQVHVKVVR